MSVCRTLSRRPHVGQCVTCGSQFCNRSPASSFFHSAVCTPPPPCINYAKVPNYYGPYAYCSLGKAVDAQVQKEKIAWRAAARKGNLMHKYPQNQSYVGSNGQTLTTNVSMTPSSWQMCHQTHVLCGRTTFVPNQIRYHINTVPTPAVAWTRA